MTAALALGAASLAGCHNQPLCLAPPHDDSTFADPSQRTLAQSVRALVTCRVDPATIVSTPAGAPMAVGPTPTSTPVTPTPVTPPDPSSVPAVPGQAIAVSPMPPGRIATVTHAPPSTPTPHGATAAHTRRR